MAEAAWSEADSALAEALAFSDELAAATTKASRQTALDLLTQALSRAGRKRGLARIGALGARERYDPKRHEWLGASRRAPHTVRVLVRGVERGGDILVKARVGSVRRSGQA